MKASFSTSLIAILGAVPYLAQGFAVPDTSSAITVTQLIQAKPVTTIVDLSERADGTNLFSKRAEEDGEWTMVIYNNGGEGQCGGVANNFQSKSGDVCEGISGLVGHVAVEMKVGINFGFGKCDFTFKKDGSSCGGQVVGDVSVDKGKSNCVAIPNDIRFVQVHCS